MKKYGGCGSFSVLRDSGGSKDNPIIVIATSRQWRHHRRQQWTRLRMDSASCLARVSFGPPGPPCSTAECLLRLRLWRFALRDGLRVALVVLQTWAAKPHMRNSDMQKLANTAWSFVTAVLSLYDRTQAWKCLYHEPPWMKKYGGLRGISVWRDSGGSKEDDDDHDSVGGGGWGVVVVVVVVFVIIVLLILTMAKSG